MQPITIEASEEATGGVLPLVGFGLALAGKLTATGGVTTWAIGSGSLILATYQTAEYLDSLRER